jgi:subtilisin family serine protease
MRRGLPTVVMCLTAGLAGVFVPPAGAAPAARASYIVVLRDDIPDPGAVAAEHARNHAAQIGFVYQSALKGYSAVIPNEQVAAVRFDGRVKYIEADQTAVAVSQTTPWGIAKVGATTSSTGAGNGSGSVTGVSVYVLDTGIDTTHPDLSVVQHVNFAGGPNKDCNGHGTHVAGTVAAKDNASDVVGVAPGANLVGVKVLGCNGSGPYSGVIRGVDWVTANVISKPGKPAAANMSLAGPVSQALDDALRSSVAKAGVLYAVAAGNEGKDACNVSPARAGLGSNNGIITVAATDSIDKEASFSNYGACVDLWAPGVGVLSTRSGGGTTTMSGTSMASPHMAGGGALYLSSNSSATPAAAEQALRQAATVTGTTSKNGQAITREQVAGF